MTADGDEFEMPPPRATPRLFGHAEAERALLDGYRSGRMPHAWLICGPRGIGKATLAYRAARFVLAHPDAAAPAVQAASSLAIDPDHAVARRVAAQGQNDLLVLERTVGDRGKLRQDIAADDVRRSVGFFGSSAGAGGWRIAIVDSVDELNAAGANALLKILEEPPERALLLLVSHAPGRILATIRSRCRVLNLRPLAPADVARAAAHVLEREPTDAEIVEAAELAEGSVARALGMLQGDVLAIRDQVIALLDRLPDTDPEALHALGDSIAGTDPQPLEAFRDSIEGWLSARLRKGTLAPSQMDRLAETWQQIGRATAETEIFNLDRKPLVFSIFGHLADAARG